MKFAETKELLWTRSRVAFYEFKEYFKVLFRYYSHWQFCKVDLRLIASYFFSSPFEISKQFLIQKGEQDVYTYGETPLTTMDLIAQQVEITSDDVFYELGCGRGRACFWVRFFRGCKVIGIDFVPEFIETAIQIANFEKVAEIQFRNENFLECDLGDATIIYLYGLQLPDQEIQKLAKRLETLPTGAKLISVGYPLKDYYSNSCYEVMHCFTAPFPWGETEVYLQVKIA